MGRLAVPNFVSGLILAISWLTTLAAQSAAEIVVGNADSLPGQSVSLPVSFQSVSACTNLQFDIVFDASNLTVGAPTPGASLTSHTLDSRIVSPGRLRVVVFSSACSALANGTPVSLPFTVAATAAPGAYTVGIADALLSSPEATSIAPLSLTPGVITVEPGSPPPPDITTIPTLDTVGLLLLAALLAWAGWRTHRKRGVLTVLALVSCGVAANQILAQGGPGVQSIVDIILGRSAFSPDADCTGDGLVDVRDIACLTCSVGPSPTSPRLRPLGNRSTPRGQQFSAQIQADDPDPGEVLAFSLDEAPQGMAIQPQTGLITWTPPVTGAELVRVRVTDSTSRSDTGQFVVTVTDSFAVTSAPRPPVLAPVLGPTLTVGEALSLQLQAEHPDPNEVLNFSLDLAPPGMGIAGAQISWDTLGREPGVHPATARVTAGNGLFDVKDFTVTLLPPTPPVARDDFYRVKAGQTLEVEPPGVLGNDLAAFGRSLTAEQLTSPAVGAVNAFNPDGSFTYVAPPEPPAAPFEVQRRWTAPRNIYSPQGFLAGDVNGDGAADIVYRSQNGYFAISGRDGSVIWNQSPTNFFCQWLKLELLADIDDDGNLELVTAGCGLHDYQLAVVDARNGNLLRQASLAPDMADHFFGPRPVISPPYKADIAVARLDPTESPKLILWTNIGALDGYYTRNDSTNISAGCRGLTNDPADQGQGCRAVLIIDPETLAVEEILKGPLDSSAAPFESNTNNQNNQLQPNPAIVADLDGDGSVEVVAGGDVWRRVNGDWTLDWSTSFTPLTSAVADLDGDGSLEVVHAFHWSPTSSFPDWPCGIRVYRQDGQLLRKIALPGCFYMGLLTVADVDGDGSPEFLIAQRGQVHAIRQDGRMLWTFDVPDTLTTIPPLTDIIGRDARYSTQPALRTSVPVIAVYDLDGDGAREVILHTAAGTYFLNGPDGSTRAVYGLSGGQGNFQLPGNVAVLDLEGDGTSEVVTVSSCPYALFQSEAYLCDGSFTALAPPDNGWLPGPMSWPQAAWIDGAVTDSGTVLFNPTVGRQFRNPNQRGTLSDPRRVNSDGFTYEAHDGTLTSNPAEVLIRIEPVNTPPRLTSPMQVSGTQFSALNYTATAIDPDPGDTLTFSLRGASVWCPGVVPTIDPATGVVNCPLLSTWSGGGVMILRVTDSQGAWDEQSISVYQHGAPTAMPNLIGLSREEAAILVNSSGLNPGSVPEIHSPRPAGEVILQNPEAGSPVPTGSIVDYTVSLGPQPVVVPFVVGRPLDQVGTTLSGLGLSFEVTPEPTSSFPTGQVLTQNPAGGTVLPPGTTSIVQLTVAAGAPPTGDITRIVVEPANVDRLVGELVPLRAFAENASGEATEVTLQVLWSTNSPSVASVDAAGTARAVGPGTADLTASLGALSGEARIAVASQVAELIPPVAEITSPVEGSVVFGPVSVIGTANDANLHRYELALAEDGGDLWTILNESTTPIVDGILGEFDPTLLVNGVVTLRLTVYDRAGNFATDEITLQVEGNRKVGHFTLSYTDMTVPVSGLPIQVVRDYDSRDLVPGEFGVGWRLGLRGLRVSTSRRMGTGWRVVRSGLDFVLTSQRVPTVTVTLPEGKAETFELRLTPDRSPLVPLITLRAGFVPQSGTWGTLECLDNTDLIIIDPQPGDVSLRSDEDFELFDPKRFRYTRKDGTEFVVSRSLGVESVRDPQGNFVTVDLDGIRHSSGVEARITRDEQGRITGITDPSGVGVAYGYSPDGNLTRFTDRSGNTTRYFYDRRHRLLRIEDPLGRQPIRAEYDPDGRLISITDATGASTRFQRELTSRLEFVEDALGGITTLGYDERGNVVLETDPLGNTTLNTYDLRDNLLSTTDPLGAVTTFTYDADDNQISVTDPLGRTTAYTYDSSGRMLSTTTPRGHTTTWQYDASGNQVRMVDPLGNVVDYGRDAAGNLTSHTDGTGTVIRNQHDPAGRRTRLIDDDGGTTDFQFDARGHVLTQLGPDGVPGRLTYDLDNRITGSARGDTGTSFEYDGAGNLRSMVTENGIRLSVETDPAGRLTGISDPESGLRFGLEYDPLARPTVSIDPAGNRTEHEYDAAGRLTLTRSADGSTESRSYDAAGRLIEVRLSSGATTQFEYDLAGQLIAQTDPVGARTEFAYDESGNRIAETDALGRTTTFEYDPLDRLVRTVFADGTEEGRSYDAASRLTGITDALGATLTFRYDSVGRLIEVEDRSGGVTRHEYDAASRRIATVDANGNRSTYGYDTLGRLDRITDPLGGVETSAFRPDGNLASRTNALGETVSLEYDPRGRLTGILMPDGAAEHFSYTVDHQVQTIADSQGITRIERDPVNRRITRIIESDGRYVRYEYDTRGNRTVVAHGDAGGEAVTRYAYDPASRVVSIIDPDGGVTDQVWDLVGNLVEIRRPGGLVSQMDYDSRNRVVRVEHSGGGSGLLAAEEYEYDAVGNRTRVISPDGSRTEYDYDSSSRVIAERTYDSGGQLVRESLLEYDAVGNLTASGPLSDRTTYSYGPDNRLLSAGGVVYEHDAAGRRVRESWTNGGVPLSVEYRWDARDRLVRFTAADGTVTEYQYDPKGTRHTKRSGPDLVRLLVDHDGTNGFSQVLRRDGPGFQDRYVWSGGLRQTSENGEVLNPHADALGSTRWVSNQAGALRDTFAYSAYGRTSARTGSSRIPYRFAGEETDPESGLIYLRARYYDPATGRFLSRDPLAPEPGNPASFNLYLYADANPVNRTDPSGEMTLMEGLFTMSQRFAAQGQQILRTRKALGTAHDVQAQTMRVLGGILGFEAALEWTSSGGGARVERWFGGGIVGSAIFLVSETLTQGEGYSGKPINFLATLGMLKTAYAMLSSGKEVHIQIQGLGVFISKSIKDSAKAALSKKGPDKCAKGDALAWAYKDARPQWIELCQKYFVQPVLPDPRTMTETGRASMGGIMLHEFTHLAIRTRDDEYECAPKSVLALAMASIPGTALFNADSYRCWAEDTYLNWSGSKLPKSW